MELAQQHIWAPATVVKTHATVEVYLFFLRILG